MQVKPDTIVVVDSGWVFAGVLSVTDGFHILNDAVNIRIWGTTRGLGQLALSGPTSETKLDPVGEVRIPSGKVLFTLPVVFADPWQVD